MARRPFYFSSLKTVAALSLIGTAGLIGGCIDDSGVQPVEADVERVLHKGESPVARVANTQIYPSDVIRAAKAQKRIGEEDTLAPDSALYTEILEELIDQRLLRLAAIEAGIDARPEVQHRLSEARERILASSFVENRLKDSVSEESLRDMYKSQSALRQNGDEANVRLIRVDTEEQIKTVVKRLEAGEDFGALASELSIDRVSRNNDGELGFVSRVMMEDALAEKVFATKAGTRSAPFKTEKGWNIIEVIGFRKPPQASFEAMREQLRQYKTYAEIQKLMTSLRAKGDIEIYTQRPALRGDAQADKTADGTKEGANE